MRMMYIDPESTLARIASRRREKRANAWWFKRYGVRYIEIDGRLYRQRWVHKRLVEHTEVG